MDAIDNSSLISYRKGYVIDPAFIPSNTWVYDSSAKTVAVKDASTFAAGDSLIKAKFRVTDKFGGEIRGTVLLTGNHAITVDVSTLNAAKGLDLEVTVLTTLGLRAEGSAQNIGGAGTTASYNITDQGNTGS